MLLSIVFVDTERVWRGGQDQLLSLLDGLHRRGHGVHLVCQPRTILMERARELGIAVYPVAIRSEIGLPSLVHLRRVIRRIRPEVLAFNTPKAILTGVLASRFSTVRARIVFRRVNFPLHGNCFTRLKYTWGIDRIIAISESIRKQLLKGGIPPSKIQMIYEGIDLSRCPRRDRTERPQHGPTVVGTVAHLSPEKGLHYLIEAASMIPDVKKRLRFVLVGDGVCRAELAELVRQRGLEEVVEFAGFHPETSKFMDTFDIFALPSLSEGLSSAILEAMATSLPIVATAVGGIPELVTTGDNGLLVAPGDPAALAHAIQQLADDPEGSRRMGERGRKRVEEQFTLERKIIETERLCSLILGRARAPQFSSV